MVKSRSRIHPLFSDVQIRQRVKELGIQITSDYANKDLVVIGVLSGVYPFFADLTRAIDMDIDVNFMRVSSYCGGLESTGDIKVLFDIDRPIKGRHVLVVEDIVDTGMTLSKVYELLQSMEPASIKVVALLDKPSRRKVKISADYVGFSIEDHFVVGYGLDLEGIYRNLPYVGIYNFS
jgi:hypoxanthine phosphoribosyltransferase